MLIRKAVEFYGAKSFQKKIIKYCQTPKDKWFWERKIITKEVISDPNCYNLITGGKRRTSSSYKVYASSKNCKEILDIKVIKKYNKPRKKYKKPYKKRRFKK